MNQSSIPKTSGAEREKLVRLLGQALNAYRVCAMSQILEMDPSLVGETVTIKTHATANPQQMPFVAACVARRMDAGLHFALAHGFDVNTPAFDGQPLFTAAVLTGRPDLLSTAIAHGARVPIPGPEATESNPPGLLPFAASRIFTLVNANLGSAAVQPWIVVARQLLDAGASPDGPPESPAPPALDTILRVNGRAFGSDGTDPLGPDLLALTADLIRHGADLNLKRGASGVRPVVLALMRQNVPALLLLVHSGADVSTPTLGKDLAEMMIEHHLDEHVPVVRSAVMAYRIAQEVAQAKAAAALASGVAVATTPPAPEPRNARRRTVLL